MHHKSIKLSGAIIFILICIIAIATGVQAQKAVNSAPPMIPRTWDDEAMASVELPLPQAGYSPVHVSSDFYYKIPVRPIYKTYPVYHPGKEPAGYLEWMKRQEPEQIKIDFPKFKSEQEWVKAGEIIFDAPIDYLNIEESHIRELALYEKTGTPVTKEGIMPFARYVVREKGKVELGIGACSNCHTRVMEDGTTIAGAQGNFPLDRVLGYGFRADAANAKDVKVFLEAARRVERGLYAASHLKGDPYARVDQMTIDEIASAHEEIPGGVFARQRASAYYPPHVPDLIGIKDRRYLDATGLVRHRSVGDLMRYAALNQGGDDLSSYGDFRPVESFREKMPEPSELGRYSDEQLYALALYIYSLRPPTNPNRFDAQAARGQKIFNREGCAMCHTPPLYTNNKLLPAGGFIVPEAHKKEFDIFPMSAGTDPDLTLKTRRGTGYYKVPSLKGVWYRSMFEHNGSVATLEDWFDPRRLQDDYVPTGFRGVGVKTRAVKGHEFGLDLSLEDRKALIRFLKTL
ncbi:MAG TPA: di-heme oxidoredictase family protein [Blastocatellia bacterium]|nr:di-heme oxidoredictase family protein [Blastocatellia bacterium]